MSALFSPLKLRELTLPNRIVVAPMCQYSAQSGRANGWHFAHLVSLSISGAAMLCLEGTAVEPIGRITPGDLGLWDDATEGALKPVIEEIRRRSPIALTLQLAHAGRKASSEVPWKGGQFIPVAQGGWVPDAPSPVPHSAGETIPQGLDLAGLDRIRTAFSSAARRAMRLGFDAIEIHGAHGYLIHEFLSPLANFRSDDYGGSLENRMRFPLEVFEAVRAEVPAGKPVGVKVSAVDWVPGGWDIEQTVRYAQELKRRGADWLTCSSAGVSPQQKIPTAENYQVPFAQAVKRDSGLASVAIGLITGARHAEAIIESGKADLVALARAMLYDPRWPWHAAAELGATVEAPPQYWRAPPHGHKGLFSGSSFGAR